jgi:hypothetical protein
MAEVYSDKPGHKSAMSWVLLALVAIVLLAIVIAYVR